MNENVSICDELDKIKAMLIFMADCTDLMLSSTIEKKEEPMTESMYGMHLFFMELISKLESVSNNIEPFKFKSS
ncbi:MAG: hypothetical protein L3V56_00310 [Candidatus Magnetoovum sp. WYHC-5]|nr:hypothetical protein [Candidatus Magnetoovum sp. WYHC-5]